MELFTLGVGHYSERDVNEAARALTGWTVDDERFAENTLRHDDGEKTILGHKGRWAGSDLVKILLDQPATAQRIAGKLCRLFFGETALPPEAVSELTTEFRERGLDIGWAVGTILKSRAFFADANLGTRVLGPVEYVAGAARALEMFDPAPSMLALADWSTRMGQELFEPPNVGGWPGGRAWIHPRGLIARANYAASLVGGTSAGRPSSYNPTALPRKYGFGSDADSVLLFHHRLLFGTDPAPGDAKASHDSAVIAAGTARLNRKEPAMLTRRALLQSSSSLLALAPSGAAVRGPHGTCRPHRSGRPCPCRRPTRRRQRCPQHRCAPCRSQLREASANPENPEARPGPLVRHTGPAPIPKAAGEAAAGRTASGHPGRGLSQPEPVALRKHGDLAHGPLRPRRAHGLRLAWAGARPGGRDLLRAQRFGPRSPARPAQHGADARSPGGNASRGTGCAQTRRDK